MKKGRNGAGQEIARFGRYIYKTPYPSLDKGTHASNHDILGICGVILSQRTSSPPPSDALQMSKISTVEVYGVGKR